MNREPLTPCFGLRITGVDLTALDAGQERAIIDAGNRAGVVHIPGQNLSEREQLDFTALFGPIRVPFSHRWTPGDVVIWDNRSTLHRGRLADPTERRIMRRTAVFPPGVEPVPEPRLAP